MQMHNGVRMAPVPWTAIMQVIYSNEHTRNGFWEVLNTLHWCDLHMQTDSPTLGTSWPTCSGVIYQHSSKDHCLVLFTITLLKSEARSSAMMSRQLLNPTKRYAQSWQPSASRINLPASFVKLSSVQKFTSMRKLNITDPNGKTD